MAPGFTVFGFPVRVRPFYLVVVTLLGLRGGSGERALPELAIWVAVVTVSILWHELGHAFSMRRYGYSPSIELHGMGGEAQWGEGAAPTPMQRVIVSLSGPFAGFLLGGLVWAVHQLTGPLGHWAAEHAVRLLLWVNIGWGILNLVPMVPWDGGNALHGLLDRLTGGRGARPTAIVTLVVAAVALAYIAVRIQMLWPAFLVLVSVAAGIRLWQRAEVPRAREAAPRRTVAPPDPLPDPLAPIREALARVGPEVLASVILREHPTADWRGAAESIERHLPDLEPGAPQAEATELTAWALLLAGDVDRAEARAARMPADYRPSAALTALLAVRRGRFEDALAAVRELDLDEDGPTRVRIEAHALVALGRAGEAVTLATESDRPTAAYVDETLYRAGEYEHAARLAERTFARFGQADDAYNVACSLARAGQPQEALGWLERAVEAGYRDLPHLLDDEDLAPVRMLEGFAALAERIRS